MTNHSTSTLNNKKYILQNNRVIFNDADKLWAYCLVKEASIELRQNLNAFNAFLVGPQCHFGCPSMLFWLAFNTVSLTLLGLNMLKDHIIYVRHLLANFKIHIKSLLSEMSLKIILYSPEVEKSNNWSIQTWVKKNHFSQHLQTCIILYETGNYYTIG